MAIYHIGTEEDIKEISDKKYIDQDGNVKQVVGKYYITALGIAKLVWEFVSSSFLDRFGNVFYDKNGVPFQGK